MPRAERAFQKQGLQVNPAPCGFRTEGQWYDLLPHRIQLQQNADALREWIALGWYLLRGRI